jgi:hypothetical protein
MATISSCCEIQLGQLYTLDEGLIRPVLTPEGLANTVRKYGNNPVCVIHTSLIAPGGRTTRPDYKLRSMFLFRAVETDSGPAIFETHLEQHDFQKRGPYTNLIGTSGTAVEAIELHKKQAALLETQGLIVCQTACNLIE